jgi:Meiotically Up-regulated Gene 113 (MUG113) protein
MDISKLLADPRPRLPVEAVASMWGCEPERIAWLADNGHLRGFMVGRPRMANLRIFPLEAENKRHLVEMPIPALELTAYAPPPPRPKKPKPERTPLLERLLEVLKQVPKDANMFVYFIACGEFVKIGQTQSPPNRVAALRTGTPYDLKLLKVVRASMRTERTFHATLREYHHRFEWFRLDQNLLAAIKRLPGVRKFHYA